jgi:TolB-like protein
MTELSTAVFLSYASQDAEAAQRICEALRAGGVEVWLDTAELRGGDAWDQKIRRQIRDCALFIPIISHNTASRLEGYFRLEWKLAVDRSHLMAAEKPFLLPIVVDATQDANAHVPDKFREVQWTRLTNGDTPPAFVERVTRLLGQSPPAPPGTGPAPSAAAARGADRGSEHSSSTVTQPPSRVSWHRALLVSIPLALLVIGYFALHRAALPPPPTPPTESPSSPRPSVQAGSPTQASQKSVAVLPFVDMSEKHDQEYFSDGLSEELIDVLIKVPGLRVPARTSSFSFKAKAVTVGEIARVLGVTHVLEGSVRKAGGRLRVTAQLIRADDGFHEWSETYDRDVHDVFAVQDDIARSVAEQLKLTLMSSISPAAAQDVSPEAHNLYLQARYRMEKEAPADLDAAVDLYQRAIAAAPRYAAPWAWLAYCQTRRIANGDSSEATYRDAKEAAVKAIELDPKLAEGYVAEAIVALQYSLDWSTSGPLLDQALAKDPNNLMALQFRGHLTQAIGSIAEAERYMRRATELDPLNPLPRRYLARIVLNAGRPTESAAILRQAIDENKGFPALHFELARALLVSGKPADAAAAYEAEPSETWRILGLPVAYHVTHRDALAQAALAKLIAQSAGSEFQVAEAYAVFGQPDHAFEWLEHARERHDAGLMYVRRDPLLASLTADPRYRALLRKMKLPE